MKERYPKSSLIITSYHAGPIVRTGRVDEVVKRWAKVVGKEMTHRLEDNGGYTLIIYPKDEGEKPKTTS